MIILFLPLKGKGLQLGMSETEGFIGGPCLAGAPTVAFTDNIQQLVQQNTVELTGKKMCFFNGTISTNTKIARLYSAVTNFEIHVGRSQLTT